MPRRCCLEDRVPSSSSSLLLSSTSRRLKEKRRGITTPTIWTTITTTTSSPPPLSLSSSPTTTTTQSSSASVVDDGVVVLTLAEVPNELERRLQTNNTDYVQVEGYVITKRGFGNSFCFLDVSDHDHYYDTAPVQVMVKRQAFLGSSTSPSSSSSSSSSLDDHTDNNATNKHFDGYMQALVPGVRIRITGEAAPTRNPGQALLLTSNLSVLGLPHNPQHARILLQLAHTGDLPLSEVADAAGFSKEEMQQRLDSASSSKDKMSDDHWRPFYGLAKEIVASLLPQRQQNYPYEILMQKSIDGHRTSLLPTPSKDLERPPDWVKRHVISDRNNVRENSLENFQAMSVGALIEATTTTERRDDQHDDLSNASSLLMVQGQVQNRRRYRGNVTVIELVDRWERDAFTASNQRRQLMCVLHPDVLQSTSAPHTADCTTYAQILGPLSQVQFQGYYCSGTISSSSVIAVHMLWVTQVRLLRSSWRPTIVQYLLELVVRGKFDPQEAAEALLVSDTEIHDLLSNGKKGLTARQWKAAEISKNLQDARSRMATISPEMEELIQDFDALRKKYPLQAVDSESLSEKNDESMSGSRWKRKKEPQIQWMTRQVRDIVRSHPDYQKRPLKILDVGGGQGFLANHLARTLSSGQGGSNETVKIQVIDVAQGAIKNGAMRSKRLNYSSSVNYTVGDASTAKFSDIDIVVALHACGTLTDVALGHAITSENNASFVISPCCFRSNPQLQVPLPTTTTIEDFLNIDKTIFDKLKLLAEVQGDAELATQAMHTICALRLSAVEQRLPKDSMFHASIKTFPYAFSSRNFCLVGEHGAAMTMK